MTIHSEHPFMPDPEDRDQARRLRGRLTAPVSIITTGSGDRRTGLTVSSLLVIEGDPPRIEAVVGPSSDLWDVTAETGRFVVHICRVGQSQLAEVFAGLRPSPGGLFASAETEQSDWGPVLVDVPDRAFCTLETQDEVGYAGIFSGIIDDVQVSAMVDPLVYFRGRYRQLE